MSDIASGRVELLQNEIIESMYRAYTRLPYYTWKRVFSELLKDATIVNALKQRGLHID